MLTLAFASLSGGQGKTTAALMTARILARMGKSVLMIDCDPQHSLTFFAGCEIEDTDPTLLEVLKGVVPPDEAIYDVDGLLIIPADHGLEAARPWLMQSGMSATVLNTRLRKLAKGTADLCIIDSPPQRTDLSTTALGAADKLIIPAECNPKGLNSVLSTLDAIAQLSDLGAFTGEILGILPFRDQWVGATRTKTSRTFLSSLEELVPDIPVLPTIRESDKFKRALDEGSTPADLGKPDLEYPFEMIVEKLNR